MGDFNRALDEIFGDTEWEILEKSYNRGFFTPDGIRTETSRTMSKSYHSQKYQNDK